MESKATTGFEPVVKVLQTSALPLGYVAMRPETRGGPERYSPERHNHILVSGAAIQQASSRAPLWTASPIRLLTAAQGAPKG